MVTIPFTTDEERDIIIAEQKKKGLFLIEVQRHFTGKFLVFDDTPLVIKSVDTIESLTARVKELESKISVIGVKL